MNILCLSDLHMEWLDFEPRMKNVDVLVLAGDIGRPLESIEKASKWCESAVALYVPGNHEFYRGDFDRVVKDMKALASSLGNVMVLDRDVAIVDGVRFLGATLWTDYMLFGPEERSRCMSACERSLNDHREIWKGGRLFSAQDALSEHRLSKHWLEHELSCDFDGKTVVITHHAPHSASLAPRFARDRVSAGFVSNLPEDLLGRADVWIHGHTHSSFSYAVGKCRVVCNPRGYAFASRTENADFASRMILSISDAGVEVRQDGRSAAEKEITETMRALSNVELSIIDGVAFVKISSVPGEHLTSLEVFAENAECGSGGLIPFFEYENWLGVRAKELSSKSGTVARLAR